ncbi:NAD-dependent epimerase/dehydratase family protein [Rubrobacter indicoceani]|uniref:NAD-dependent epimerase/dehydratase family protein n=1 Tax=Rubrobacter indicoceani TaxID=2051957 RepID=UPI001F098C64|nr:NAD-dependent epimerase/dehydratase family protein [Rubrobacter indicoceani]
MITGGCGFLGTAFIRGLLERGEHAVRVVDNLSVGTRDDLAGVCDFSESDARGPFPEPGSVELVVGDILDEELALQAADGADVVVHFAANTGVAPSVEDPRRDCFANVIGTLNYLEAARHGGVSRFVSASSGAALGEVEPPLSEEKVPHPVSPYGASKMAGEAYCSAYHKTFGVQTVALRFGNVYGPLSGHKNSAVARFIRRAMNGERLEIYGSGSQTRDFVYIEDLVRAVYLAATVPGVGGEVFQIATSAETSVDEMVALLLPALAESGFDDIDVIKTEPRQGDVMRNYADTQKARRLLGWSSEVGLEDGLRRTVSWFTEGPRNT